VNFPIFPKIQEGYFTPSAYFILATCSLKITKFDVTHHIDMLLHFIQTIPELIMNPFQIVIDIVGSSGIAAI